MNTTFYRIGTFSLGLLLIAPLCVSTFPRDAHAQWVVSAPILEAKDVYGLDAVAWLVAKTAIQSMTRSTINWINSGFNGSPSFVTNLEDHLLSIGDVAAMNFIKALQTDPALGSPFQSKIAQTAYLGYLISTSNDAYVTVNGYNLNQVTPYHREFLQGDFSKGGWDAWLSVAMNPGNSPYGASYTAQNGLRVAVENARNQTEIQLNWGQGFLSWCGEGTATTPTFYDEEGGTWTNDTGNVVDASMSNPALSCTKEDGRPGSIQTPGSVIQSQINQTLGLSGDQLVSADEFNEIIAALMSQLTSQVLGGVGLGGASSPSSGGRSYIDRATDSNAYAALNSNAAGGLSKAVASQKDLINQYQRDWNALSAQASAASCSSDSIVRSTLADAVDAQEDITAAMTALDAVNAKIAATTGGRGQGSSVVQLEAAAAEFEKITSNPPSSSEMSRIHAEAIDNSAQKNAVPTLITRLKALADSCD